MLNDKMQAVILAAGKSTRTYPLTLTRPKPLLKVGKKTLLEHNLEQLDGLVDELILVVGYKKDMLINFVDKIRNRYKFKISFVEQKGQLGTGHALLQVKDIVKGRFLLMMGDDIYSRGDIENCMKHDFCILARKVKDPSNFGILEVIGKNVKNIIEKPQLRFSDLANCALYVMDKKIFDMVEKLKKSKRKEYEITSAIKLLAQKIDIPYVLAKEWIPVGYPWDLFNVKKVFGIKGNAVGGGCKVDGDVKDCIIMDRTIIEKGSYIENSIIGEAVYFNGIAKAADNVVSVVRKLPRDAGRLGAVIGDGVKAEEVNIKPGCKIWPGNKVKGEIMGDVR